MNVIAFRKKPLAAAASKPQRKREPRGYLLVPARIMDSVAKLEASLDAITHNDAAHADYASLYQILAILDLSTRYEP